jgi:Fic family protein
LDHLVSFLFLRKEAVESSRMEGTLTTIDHILTPGEFFDGWKTKSDGASVRGYAYALEKELTKVKTAGLSIFTVNLASRLHKETMSLDPKFKGIPGRMREPGKPGDIVWIGGHSRRPEDSIYNPTPARHVLSCIQDTMRWLGNAQIVERGNAGMGMPLVVRLAIGHAHFEGIHPFSDGNGRVGRMLLTLQMACQGKLPIYLSGYIEQEKQSYSLALQEAQKKLNYTFIIEFFAKAIITSHREANQTRESIAKLPLSWRERGSFRKNSTAERALLWLMSHPIFTAKQLQEELAVSPQAANNAVDSLRKNKIVRERTGFERNRVFAAEEVISLLSRSFGSDSEEALEGARFLMGEAL